MDKVFRLVGLLATLLILSACSGLVVETPGVSFDQQRNQLTLKHAGQTVVFSAPDSYTIEVNYPELDFKGFPSFAKKESSQNVRANYRIEQESLTFKTEEITVKYRFADGVISFYRGGELLSQQMSVIKEQEKIGFEFSLVADEKLIGGGQRVLGQSEQGMNRRGYRIPLYNRAHYGYETHSEQMYFSLPAIISDKKYMITFDNAASGFLDMGKTKRDSLVFEAKGGRAAYLFTLANSYPELIRNYTHVSGRQPMPPRWALGNYASRFGYRNQKEVLETIERFIAMDIPLDVLILDLYWFGPDIKGHMGNLDWDKEAFPEPEKMIAELKEKGVKTIPITEPFVLSSSKRWQEAVENQVLAKNEEGEPYRFDFYFGNTGLVDVFDGQSQQWFWQKYESLFKQGIAGTWGDLGEPEVHPDDILHHLSRLNIIARGDELHNAYGHQWAKMVFENQRKLDPEVRPFIMMRSGFAGSQRYGMIPWTGDVNRSWGGLKPQVELSLQMGMLGMAYNHSDLGGFAGGEAFDKELYIRWLEYGVFQPVFRPHAQEHIAPEPIFHDKETRDIVRDYIKLRYQLLPYLYTMVYDNATSGLPLMRPLSFLDETSDNYFNNISSYLWGDAFLIAPIVNPGLDKKSVNLPEGVWFNFWSEQKIEGGRKVDIPVSIEQIPVLVKAGAFVPMVDAVQSTKDYSSKRLYLHYFADKSVNTSQGKMFEDDGESFNSLKNGEFELLHFTAYHQEGKLDFSFERETQGYRGMPETRKVNLVVHGVEKMPAKIMVDGKVVEPGIIEFNKKKRQVSIPVDWNHSLTSIVIEK
ncbi:TIM-barrel domain-containing protein [Aliikangiella sp. G2MR2-5]|uniref:TIM-barrel domain-containing protein n=1 Tax=Aliikangiella sp. G2MR2-5 TaxID=2788943 RepID=UPI0018AA0AEC|nr:TIM-barrel domain-containing protein [Aliikangiella sp. G2MR2-5]